jgi:hypothetical protein
MFFHRPSVLTDRQAYTDILTEKTDMGIMSKANAAFAALTPTEPTERDIAAEKAIAAVHAAEKSLAEIHKRVELAASKHQALERTRAAIALAAEESGTDAAWNKFEAAVAASKSELVRAESALLAAQERLADAHQTSHLASHEQQIRHTRRLLTARLKHYTATAEGIAAFADGFRRSLAANEKILMGISWPRGIPDIGAGLGPQVLLNLLARELARVHVTNPIEHAQHPPLPGALVNAHVDPSKLRSLVDEVAASNDYILGLVSAVPK